jgi:hypothetical protein
MTTTTTIELPDNGRGPKGSGVSSSWGKSSALGSSGALPYLPLRRVQEHVPGPCAGLGRGGAGFRFNLDVDVCKLQYFPRLKGLMLVEFASDQVADELQQAVYCNEFEM